MKIKGIQWTRAAKAVGGLGAVFTLLAHFWLPSLPLTLVRVELLLFLIGVLLGLDMLTENFPVSVEVSSGDDAPDNDNEGQEHDD